MPIVPVSQVEIGFFSYIIMFWGILLFGGLLFSGRKPKGNQQIPRWARLGSSCVLAIGAWLWFAISLGAIVDALIIWIALGMSLSLLGDVLLSGILQRRHALLEGMGAFAIAHIAYIIGLLAVGQALHLADWQRHLPWLLLFVVTSGTGWYLVVFFKQSYRTLAHYVALPYTILLSTTAGLSVIIALQNPFFSLLSVGTILFLLSDLVLAVALFRYAQRAWLHDVVWVLYGTGQMLIVFGLLLQLVLGFPAS